MTSMKMNRRKFVAALGLGTAHALFSNPLYASGSVFTTNSPVQRIRLGNSGLETTMIGVGTGVHAGNRISYMTKQERDKSVGLLNHAYDMGIRNFDCADTYGTHGFMNEALKKMDREKITITSKIWFRAGGIPEPERPDANIVVDRFRKELGTDYLDLVQIHCMVEDNWTETYARQMDIMEDLKAKGIIRAHGVSVHSLGAMRDALNSPWVDVIHVRINPYGMAMDKPDPQEVVEVIQQLHKKGKGVIGMKLVGNGKLRNDSKKIDDSLRFVLGLGCVDMMIIGFEENEQINNYLSRVENALIEKNRG